MRASGRAWVALAALGFLASPARADRPQTREGFWIGFGFGYGSADADCDGCGSGERERDFTGLFKIGGTLGPRLLLGSETNVWHKEDFGSTLDLGTVTAAAYFYPTESSGFFLKGGAGVSVVRTEVLGVEVEGAGWGLMVGAGYDLRIRRMLSLTPSATYFFGQPGDLKLSGATVLSGWKHNVVDFTIGLTFH